MLPPHIRDVEYDSEHKLLTIRFQVGSYQYAAVPYELGLKVRQAFLQRDVSPDELEWLFNNQVEGKYKSTRIGS